MRQIARQVTAGLRRLRAALSDPPISDPEQAAWVAYESQWAMDPPPEPRAVFLAGYRAAREELAEGQAGRTLQS